MLTTSTRLRFAVITVVWSFLVAMRLTMAIFCTLLASLEPLAKLRM